MLGMGKPEWLAALAMPALLAAQQEPQVGQALFTEHCAVCHGAVAEGGAGPDLTNPRWLAAVNDAERGRRRTRPDQPALAGGRQRR